MLGVQGVGLGLGQGAEAHPPVPPLPGLQLRAPHRHAALRHQGHNWRCCRHGRGLLLGLLLAGGLLGRVLVLVAGLGQLGVQAAEPLPQPRALGAGLGWVVDWAARGLHRLLEGDLLGDEAARLVRVLAQGGGRGRARLVTGPYLDGHLADEPGLAAHHVGVALAALGEQLRGAVLLDDAGEAARQGARARHGAARPAALPVQSLGPGQSVELTAVSRPGICGDEDSKAHNGQAALRQYANQLQTS